MSLHDSCADPAHAPEANGRSLPTLHKTSPSMAELMLRTVEPLTVLPAVCACTRVRRLPNTDHNVEVSWRQEKAGSDHNLRR